MARTYGHEEMERIRKYAFEKGNDYTRQEVLEIIEHYKELNGSRNSQNQLLQW
jgi:hypothetical protein